MGRWLLIRHQLKRLKHESKLTLVSVLLLLPSPMGDALPLWFAGGRASVATSLLLLAACRIVWCGFVRSVQVAGFRLDVVWSIPTYAESPGNEARCSIARFSSD